MQDAKQFRRWVKWLREDFPSEYPVRVLLVPASSFRGQFEVECYSCYHFIPEPTGRFLVRVANSLPRHETADALDHEWAHVLREHIPPSKHDQRQNVGWEGEDSLFQNIYGRIRFHRARLEAEGRL